jgi:formylglycine-generating enzyme required for sulfatase activity
MTLTRLAAVLAVGSVAVVAASGCNVFTDLDALRSEGTGDTCEIDNACEGCTARNACGGCGTLAGDVDDACGTCASGTLQCEGESLTCTGDAGAAAQNVCGGCMTLQGELDDACGICDSGSLRCDRKEALVCDGDREDARNACGGCAELEGTADDPCGACDSGNLACADDDESLVCNGDLGDGARNECGGCGELIAEPGTTCMDGCGTYICEEGAVVCDAEEPPIWYQDNDDDDFGDPNAPTMSACEQPDNHVSNADDCNDGAMDVNPDEDESPDDGLDNNCDGLLLISGDSFGQGSPMEELGHETEEVQRTVTLTGGLSVSRTEVTRGQWDALMPNTPPADGCEGDDCPVACVNFYEAAAFLNAWSTDAGRTPCYTLTDCSGTAGTSTCDDGTPDVCADNYRCAGVEFAGIGCDGYRLPTEAESEFLTRGGTRSGHYRGEILARVGCIDDNLDDLAWWCGNGDNTSHEVAAKLSNPFGLYDTLGNLEEWTGDGYGERSSDPATDPVVPHADALVVTGGSFRDQGGRIRSAARSSEDAVCGSRFRGFRAVIAAD